MVDDRAAQRKDGRLAYLVHTLDVLGMRDMGEVIGPRPDQTPARPTARRPRRSRRQCQRGMRSACCQSRSRSAAVPRQSTTRAHRRRPSAAPASAPRRSAVNLSDSPPFSCRARASRTRRKPGSPAIPSRAQLPPVSRGPGVGQVQPASQLSSRAATRAPKSAAGRSAVQPAECRNTPRHWRPAPARSCPPVAGRPHLSTTSTSRSSPLRPGQHIRQLCGSRSSGFWIMRTNSPSTPAVPASPGRREPQ